MNYFQKVFESKALELAESNFSFTNSLTAVHSSSNFEIEENKMVDETKPCSGASSGGHIPKPFRSMIPMRKSETAPVTKGRTDASGILCILPQASLPSPLARNVKLRATLMDPGSFH